jgi:hypothetical protein
MARSLLHYLLYPVTLAVLSFTAIAQTPTTTTWSDDALNLHLAYPADLVKADPSQIVHEGKLTLLGVSSDSDPQLAAATHCVRPILLLQTSPQPATATILLAELDVGCLTPEEQVKSHDLLATMAEAITKVPGMKPIADPSVYTIGMQKVHMAVAQAKDPPLGQSQSQPPATPHPQQPYAIALSTNWNNHLLVWYFSSDSIDTLNRITKTTVRFGHDTAAPLYPVNIGNASAAQ